jgi:hypothetical protein
MHLYQGANRPRSLHGRDDNSPNSLNKELEDHRGRLPDRATLCQMVLARIIDIEQIGMPSFRAFRDRLEEVT